MAPVKVIKNYHILRNYFKKRFVSKFKRKSKVQCIDEKNIDVILSQHPASEIFIHAGLSDIKSGLNVSNPTDWVVTKFSNYWATQESEYKKNLFNFVGA